MLRNSSLESKRKVSQAYYVLLYCFYGFHKFTFAFDNLARIDNSYTILIGHALCMVMISQLKLRMKQGLIYKPIISQGTYNMTTWHASWFSRHNKSPLTHVFVVNKETYSQVSLPLRKTIEKSDFIHHIEADTKILLTRTSFKACV